MKQSKLKILACSAAVLSMVLAATACSGGGGSNNDTAGNSSPAPAATQSASPSESPAASESASPSASVSETRTGEGEYVGMMDGHSVEIKVDGVPTPFQIDEDTAEKVSPWEEGTQVKFQYVETTQDINGEQVKQFSIMAIEKA